MSDVTVWYRKRGDDWRFNHVADGYDPAAATPTPISDEQVRAWAGASWRAVRGVMQNGSVKECPADSRSGGPT